MYDSKRHVPPFPFLTRKNFDQTLRNWTCANQSMRNEIRDGGITAGVDIETSTALTIIYSSLSLQFEHQIWSNILSPLKRERKKKGWGGNNKRKVRPAHKIILQQRKRKCFQRYTQPFCLGTNQRTLQAKKKKKSAVKFHTIEMSQPHKLSSCISASMVFHCSTARSDSIRFWVNMRQIWKPHQTVHSSDPNVSRTWLTVTTLQPAKEIFHFSRSTSGAAPYTLRKRELGHLKTQPWFATDWGLTSKSFTDNINGGLAVAGLLK